MGKKDRSSLAFPIRPKGETEPLLQEWFIKVYVFILMSERSFSVDEPVVLRQAQQS